jgi:hypothetical protein
VKQFRAANASPAIAVVVPMSHLISVASSWATSVLVAQCLASPSVTVSIFASSTSTPRRSRPHSSANPSSLAILGSMSSPRREAVSIRSVGAACGPSLTPRAWALLVAAAFVVCSCMCVKLSF